MHQHTGMRHKNERKKGSRSESDGETRYVRALDHVTFAAGVIGPFTVVPQTYDLFWRHQAAGVSVTAWVLMFIVTLPWIFYGMAHRDKSIIWSFVLWEVANAAVVVGALMYR